METPFGLPSASEFQQSQAPSRVRYVIAFVIFAIVVFFVIWGLQYFFSVNLSQVQRQSNVQNVPDEVKLAIETTKQNKPEVIIASPGEIAAGFPVGFLLKELKFSILSSQKTTEDGNKVSYLTKLKSPAPFNYVKTVYMDFFRKYGYTDIKTTEEGDTINISAKKQGATLSIVDQAVDGGSLVTISYKTP